MPIHLDFSDIPTFESLPTGQYPAIIDHVELRDSKNTPGTQYLNWDMVVTDGEYQGRHIFMSSGLSAKALWHLKGTFMDLGIINDESQMVDLDVDEASSYVIDPPLAGMPVFISLVEKIVDGKTQNDVTKLQAMEAPVLVKAPATPAAGQYQRPIATQKPVLKLK